MIGPLMNRRHFLSSAASLGALPGLGSLPQPTSTRHTQEAAMPANVLVIQCDQLRHDWLTCTGHPNLRTPNIDALRDSGRLFSNHWVTNPVCQPSRASLHTGLLPCTHGLWANGTSLSRRDHSPGLSNPFRNEGRASLRQQAPTMADCFASAGYRTAAFGKLHLQPYLYAPEGSDHEYMGAWKQGRFNADWTGPYFGFQHAEFCLGHHDNQLATSGHYGAWLKQRDPALVQAINDDPPKGASYISPIPHALHNTSWLAERFDRWLDQSDNPFMAYVSFPGPHHPFAPSQDILPAFDDWQDPGCADQDGAFLQHSGYGLMLTEPTPPQIDYRQDPDTIRTARRYTAAMILQIDQAVGEILASLERHGLRQQTYIAFTSDHGDFLGNHQLLYKHMVACRDLMQVPFILSGPSMEPGSIDRNVMSNIDVLPTLLALTGTSGPAVMPGRDRSRLGSGRDHRAYGTSWNSLISGSNHHLDNFSVMDGRYRATFYPRHGLRELYDLEIDPWECHNLAGQAEHAPRLRDFRQQMMETLFASSLPNRDRNMFF